MTWNNKVVWSEGMFLRPTHFQQHVRYVENLVERRGDSLRSHPWGFKSLKLDQELLRLGKLGIAAAEGVFADGTPFSIPGDDEPPLPLDLGPDVRNAVVCLGLPARRPASTEVTADAEGDILARFVMREYEAVDTHSVGSTPAPLQVARLNLKLVLEKDSHAELVPMGVARVVECRDDKTVMLDDAYIPPTLECRASPVLAGFLKEVQGLLHHRAEALAGRISDAGRGGMSEVADFLLLQAVNRYEPLFAHHAASSLLHPEDFYMQGLELAGELATFTHPRKRPPEFPPYSHDNPQLSFRPLMVEIRRSLSMVLEQTAVPIPLEERKYGIRVGVIPDRTLVTAGVFVLAVQAQMPAEELRRRFPTQAKIGPVEKIRQLVNVQLPGIQVRALPVAPRQLPYHAGRVYFELDRANEFWPMLEHSGGIALHAGGDFPGLDMELWAIRA